MVLTINGRKVEVNVEANMPLLWVLRDELHMTGTKYGCGIAQCGACSVIVDGKIMRSCVLPTGSLEGMKIETIESLDQDGTLSKLQEAWIDNQVPQCGYCQSGMIMAATNLLTEIPQPTDEDIDKAMTNICRCGTYNRVRAAIHQVAAGDTSSDLSNTEIESKL